MALYGFEALSFADLVFGDYKAQKAKYWLQDNQDILKALKNNLQMAHNQQKNLQISTKQTKSFKWET